MAAVASNPPPPPPSREAKLESLTHIDMSKLSQSDLRSLSLCSDSVFDLRSNIVTPNVDRSTFNESAGSRRQTYSRLRHNRHHHHRTATTRLHSTPTKYPYHHPHLYDHHVPRDPETHSVLHFLKHFLTHSADYPAPPPPPPSPPPPPPSPPQPIFSPSTPTKLQEKMAIALHAAQKKRKRGRTATKRSLQENGVEMIVLENVNGKGEKVDLKALENHGDELFSAELKRRTVGLDTEEQVLGFLAGLEGQWCSRRRKRKYVDAGEFGDALPVGWKLLLGLRRREGHVSVYCRRYISPTGQHFLSCKEVSSFLQFYLENNDENQCYQRTCSNPQAYRVASKSDADNVQQTEGVSHGIVTHLNEAASSVSYATGVEVCLLGIDNLPDVQIRDAFECYKCKKSFEEKNAYLQHLISFHQHTTRRYNFGTTVGDGVIIRDGMFQCQICHKVFEDKQSYNGHVGTHNRKIVESPEELPAQMAMQTCVESPSQDNSPSVPSKMDCLVQIAHSFSLENSSAGFNDNALVSPPTVSDSVETLATKNMLNLGQTGAEDRKYGRALHENLQRDNEHIKDGDRMVRSNEARDTGVNLCGVSTSYSEVNEVQNVEKTGINETDQGRATQNSGSGNECAAGTMGLAVKRNVINDSMPHVQSPGYFSFSAALDKVADGICVNKPEKITVSEELRLDDIEPFKCNFDGQGSLSLPGVSADLANDAEMDGGYVLYTNSKASMLNSSGTHHTTTVCVWCRAEFKLEAADSGAHSDSIGFMCPTCKDKVSRHIGDTNQYGL